MTARIVPADEAAAVRHEADRVRVGPGRGPASHGGELAAILDGGMVHFDDEAQHFNRKAIRTRFSRRLRLRSDGDGGRYYWTEPLS